MSKATYVKAIVSYDIETTSFKEGETKLANVYTHTLSVDGVVTIHRTWTDFLNHLDLIIDKYEVDLTNRLVIYVHNLSYEFAFIKHYFDWLSEEVNAIGSVHRIVKAVTNSGIEFRCSYMLTNSSLAHVGREVGLAKAEGDLDYELPRHSDTELDEDEIGYIVADVEIIDRLIQARLEEEGDFTAIPWTSTGYVRRDVRNAVQESKSYNRLIKSLTMSESDYVAARAAFQGGYVHANASQTARVHYNVSDVDLSSSYPASMIRGLYPMNQFVEVPGATWERALELLDGTCQLLDVTLMGVQSRYPFPPISESRAISSQGTIIDNGRVYTAEEVRVVCTDVDMEVYLRAYDIDHIQVNNLRISTSEPLPQELGMEILRYYGMKTELKGVDGQEENYRLGKAYTNSIYGMVATDPVRDEFMFSNDYKIMTQHNPTISDVIGEHNSSRGRFLFYPWSAWVTAYSRRELLMTIYDMIDAGVTVLYCDTDSIFYIDNPTALDIIEERNRIISEEVAEYNPSAPNELFAPVTVKGVAKPLGAWDFEGTLQQFKTLGAKRYASVEADGSFSLTVSGLSKHAAKYVEDMGGMDFFADGMTIPAEFSGRTTHEYSDDTVVTELTDHNGVTSAVEQTGWVHLEASDYSLTIGSEYRQFISRMSED